MRAKRLPLAAVLALASCALLPVLASAQARDPLAAPNSLTEGGEAPPRNAEAAPGPTGADAEAVPEATAPLVKRGYLGVALTELTPELRVHFGAPENAGVMVAHVVPGSPADHAGLKVGDILIAMDGAPISSSWDIRGHVRPLAEGATLAIELRRNAQPQSATATIALRARRDLGAVSDAAGANGALCAPAPTLQQSLAPLMTAREELLEKKLRILQKRLNELESRIPKS